MSEKQKNEHPELGKLTQKIVESSKEVAKNLPVLGNVLWLYMQSNIHQHYFIKDMDSRVLPPLMKKQFKLYVQGKTGGLPMAFVSWAFLSEDAEQAYCATQKIAPKDWKSGDTIWLVDVLTPFGGNKMIFKELYYDIFKQQEMYLLYPDDNGVMKKTALSELAKKFAELKEHESKKGSGKAASDNKEKPITH